MRGKNILITGGTGTVGRALVERLLKQQPDIGCICVFSRDEQKHFEMAARFPTDQFPIRYIVGDVRDRDRVMMACRGVDILVHTAAMKHVPVSQHNPIECAKTNIIGSQNIIDAAVINNVKRVVTLTSDKAVLPINAYGASKLMLERLFVEAGREQGTIFSVVRFANVFGSKGSVVPFFLQHQQQGFLPITHPEMTRFSISMAESLDLIQFAIEHARGGEVVLPVSPSYRILDVVEAVAPGIETRVVGLRPGEKLHETMLGAHESDQAVRLGPRYIVCPKHGHWGAEQYCTETGATRVERGFEYNSGRNTDWLSVEQIRALVSALAEQ